VAAGDAYFGGTVTAGTVNLTTLDLTNLEVTNIKAKDGTAAMTIADSTGVVSFTANPVLSGGTANGVTYLNGSKVLTSGSALVFDGTNLGVGDSTPGTTLPTSAGWQAFGSGKRVIELRASGAIGSNSGVFIRNTGATSGLDLWADNYYGNAYVDNRFDNAAGSIVFRLRTAGTPVENLILTSSSLYTASGINVGIGLTNPTAKLDVNKSANDTITRANAAGAFGDLFTLGAGLLMQQTLSSPYGFVLQASNAANSAQFPLVLNPSGGNVGIGTSSPAKLLDVNGDALINGLTVGRGSGNQATNTAVGYQAGLGITTSIGATLIGYQAGSIFTSSKSYNTMIGYRAGSASTATTSTFIGYLAGNNCTGISNTFVGPQNDSSGGGSGELITAGNYNTILGAFTGNSNGLDIRTASNYVVLSDGVGNPLISTANSQTVALKGAVPNSGTGITFPATQSASSDANTLDDYEEGTWTPTFGGSDSDPTVTYVAQIGTYTKIGRVVTVSLNVNVGTISGGNGVLYIKTLPFGSSIAAMGAAYTAGINWNTRTQVTVYSPGGGNTYLRLLCSASNTSDYDVAVSDINATDSVIATITYFV
jgi:hypothetical protein